MSDRYIIAQNVKSGVIGFIIGVNGGQEFGMVSILGMR